MDTPIKIEREPGTISREIASLRELEESHGWTQQLLPEIQRLEREHTDMAINPNLHPEARATHLHAIHVLRHLALFPHTKTLDLQAAWKLKQQTSQP